MKTLVIIEKSPKNKGGTPTILLIFHKKLKVCKEQELKQLEPNSGPKTKTGITYITNSQNTKRTYGQPSEQLFPKRWAVSK